MTLDVTKTIPTRVNHWRDNLARWIANTAVRLIATREYRRNLTATMEVGMAVWADDKVLDKIASERAAAPAILLSGHPITPHDIEVAEQISKRVVERKARRLS